ncbi:hypothetical protein EIP86_007039 [Pleurotus ostreatoroseus]|nr:hypothetical protein EIP86_007039 [Pleurotus ostreatoroseus]
MVASGNVIKDLFPTFPQDSASCGSHTMSLEKLPTTSLAEVAPDDEKRLYDQDSSLKHKEIAAVDERKLLRKIDLRLVPVLCILYLLAFLDRVNISNASLFGLKQDLKLEGDQYNTSLLRALCLIRDTLK